MGRPLGEPGSVWRELAWILEDGRRAAGLLRRNARYGLAAVLVAVLGLGLNLGMLALVRRAAPPAWTVSRAAAAAVWRQVHGGWQPPWHFRCPDRAAWSGRAKLPPPS